MKGVRNMNPWRSISLIPPYIAEGDEEQIRRYNNLTGDKDRQVILDSIPEPFIGNPESARLVLLGLNPGHSDADSEWHSRQDFRNAMIDNLHNKSRRASYPFYPLNPAFKGNGAGRWWRPRTQELQDRSGLDTEAFAKRVLVIEWFPYHTRKSPSQSKSVCGASGYICDSQNYSVNLARELLDKSVLVVGMRSRKLWARADERFGRIPYLTNPQSGYISSGNNEQGVFDQMVKALSA